MNAKQNVLLICLTVLTIFRFANQMIVVRADNAPVTPVVRLTNDQTYPREALSQAEIVAVTNGQTCGEYETLGSTDDFIHCRLVDGGG